MVAQVQSAHRDISLFRPAPEWFFCFFRSSYYRIVFRFVQINTVIDLK